MLYFFLQRTSKKILAPKHFTVKPYNPENIQNLHAHSNLFLIIEAGFCLIYG